MPPDQDRARIAHFRPLLERELEETLSMRDSTEQARDTVALDQQSVGRLSRIDAMQQQQMALAADRARQQRIARIKAALERMDKDEFGDCLACGEPIPDGRLTADPTALFCVACAKARGG
jgi:RNA polymerase-binding transcription factor